MKTISIGYPEAILSVLNLSAETFEEEARYALSMKLFEMGRLTSGQAAVLAGIPRVDFLVRCRQYGTATVDWDQDEIDAEFGDAGP